MRLPALFRTTPFRLTLMFLAAFALSAAAFLFYIYAVTAGEVTRRADRDIAAEMRSLEAVWRQGGINALNQALIERTADGRPFLYLLTGKDGKVITGTIKSTPIQNSNDAKARKRPSDSGTKYFIVLTPPCAGMRDFCLHHLLHLPRLCL